MLTQVEGAGITAIRGADATRARLLAEFRSGDYDAIHFAGHAWFDAAAPASSGILCAGGRVLSGADLAAMDSVPALVFFNACESGRLRATINPLRQLDRSVGFAEAFLRGGVANFIGTWWPVSDIAAAAFAATLYRDLAKGESIGNALNAARTAVRGLPSADWANYLHYGSYDFSLKAPKG
jgi:CHAT domain-containing protein